jgi:hypothetical protein
MDQRAVLHCLAINSDGQPRHPLYVPSDTKTQGWFVPEKWNPKDGR